MWLLFLLVMRIHLEFAVIIRADTRYAVHDSRDVRREEGKPF